LKKEDVRVHIEGDTLVVEGERKQEKEEKRESYYHSERGYGKFYRSILLPEGATADQTAAQFNNGVLEVTVPVPEMKATRKEIPVQEGSKKGSLAARPPISGVQSRPGFGAQARQNQARP
jgi:HSP20 family protein